MDGDESRHAADDAASPSKPTSVEPPPSNRGLIGILFAIVLVCTAVWLMNRMQTWASIGDCAFTHAPQCRELLK